MSKNLKVKFSYELSTSVKHWAINQSEYKTKQYWAESDNHKDFYVIFCYK